jgi:hypothetical protein
VKPEEWGHKSLSKSLTGSLSSDSISPIINHERNDDAHAKKGAQAMATKTEPLSAKEAATELGTDARTLRKFLRKRNGLVGQGQRWAIDRKDIKALKAEFDAWAKGGKVEGNKATTKVKKSAPPADETIDEMDSDFEALEDLDLDELEELDD